MSGRILTIPAAQYHADELGDAAGGACLSSSIARILLSQSPAHAYAAHPKLGAQAQEESGTFDLGTAAHTHFLEAGRPSSFAIMLVDDWRTKAAQEARTKARAEGLIPILGRQHDEVEAMSRAIYERLGAFEEHPVPFTSGKPEQTLVWEENGVWLKARLDWLHDDYGTIDDLKSTGKSAEPNAYIRAMFNSGWHVQAAFYIRGLKAVTGADAVFRFVVVENTPPFALSVIALDPAALQVASDACDQAVHRWRQCITSGQWPGYATRVHYAAPPSWAVAEAEAYEWSETP